MSSGLKRDANPTPLQLQKQLRRVWDAMANVLHGAMFAQKQLKTYNQSLPLQHLFEMVDLLHVEDMNRLEESEREMVHFARKFACLMNGMQGTFLRPTSFQTVSQKPREVRKTLYPPGFRPVRDPSILKRRMITVGGSPTEGEEEDEKRVKEESVDDERTLPVLELERDIDEVHAYPTTIAPANSPQRSLYLFGERTEGTVACKFCHDQVHEKEMVKHVKTFHAVPRYGLRPFTSSGSTATPAIQGCCLDISCDYVSETEAQRLVHVKSVHCKPYNTWIAYGRLKLDPESTCPHCPYVVPHIVFLREHLLKKHPNLILNKRKIYTCSSCDARFSRLHEVYDHWHESSSCTGLMRIDKRPPPPPPPSTVAISAKTAAISAKTESTSVDTIAISAKKVASAADTVATLPNTVATLANTVADPPPIQLNLITGPNGERGLIREA